MSFTQASERLAEVSATVIDVSKVYLFRISGHNPALAKASLEEFCGVPCIKGTVVSKLGSWIEGQTGYIPISKIESVVVFDSIAEFEEKMREYYKKNPPK